MVLILAVTCAVAVGNLYFPQAIVPLIAAGLHTSADSASMVVTATQVGYTAGIFLLVPLGDRLPYRPYLVTLLTLTGLSLLGAGCAPTLPVLVAAGVLVGVTSVAAQIIAPLAARLVAAAHRGAVMGTLLSGSIGGMLLARTFSGTLGEWLGWRAPYLAAGILVLALAAVLARTVPATTSVTAEPPPPPSRERSPALLTEPLRLLRAEPELRRSCVYQASVFAGFSAVWTCLALLLTGPAYGLGGQAVGMLALVGAATMLCTPLAGHLVDRKGPDPVNLVCLLAVLLSAVVLAGGAGGGVPGLTALTLGTLLLDVAMQCGMVANQARVFALRPDARARLNTAYMTCAYLGGSAGSWFGVRVYGRTGWWGVCVLLALLAALPAVASRAGIRTRWAGQWNGPEPQ
ncbi:MFS transporter [Streptomyces sp. NBC_01006]|uniref:MFS transporter n=1 Tax=Streptomyces sp. NBC_01006 TaxID=2903716 RepID=UPI00386E6B32|nr:MFS transporter [Streptomyces sp. NBC_01006]